MKISRKKMLANSVRKNKNLPAVCDFMKWKLFYNKLANFFVVVIFIKNVD